MSDHAKRYQLFAQEAKDSSPLYEHLAWKISEDMDMLRLSGHAAKGQPEPNLFLGAVHYLLLQGRDHSLQAFYPSLVENPADYQQVFPEFKDFCTTHQSSIIDILESKRVQTNEVRRCAYLYPIFCGIFKQTNKPLSLIEIGTSAGLQLLVEQYSYSYGDGIIYGNPSAALHITSRVRKGKKPPHLAIRPSIVSRVGVDLHCCDVTKASDYNWLRALIWPENQERVELLASAVEQLKKSPPCLLEGDGVKRIVDLSKQAPADSIVCIFHTHVANQIPLEVKNKLMDNLQQIAKHRDVIHIYNNMSDRNLHIDAYINGEEHMYNLGETDGHGRWFDWEWQNK
ncbi:hypothetical protein GCM10007111_18790 [Virgibacillus kapii]|uniref:DUF2332 family protein n=3 Tax=Bacillaceae TaxID=186817 RepID=A0A024Q5P0_9BACI|nr:hypothetical protein M948_08870 [Virgibacillus sp. CM-4]GGJ56886.1 hypothetical protein GCM10007111_18790 [Virgibacillus kapii]CDQ37804.1 hypothetical protein BN990_00060 [Virgibacillus massiliensis]